MSSVIIETTRAGQLQQIRDYFGEMAQIPRLAGDEAAIRQYIIDWATTHGYEHRSDEVGNIVVVIPGAGQCVDGETIVLQAHLDMVCVGGNDTAPTTIVMDDDGDTMRADGTTLGADNGIGVAMMMAAASLAEHPPLELLFTVSEEVGLIGALGIDGSIVTGSILINLDTEEVDELCIGSAGGGRVDVAVPLQRELIPAGYETYDLTLYGGLSGHSGADIHLQRVNALYELASLLATCELDYRLISINGGAADNVIPGEGHAVIALRPTDAQAMSTYIGQFLGSREMLYSDQLLYRLSSVSSPYESCIVDHEALLYCLTSVLPGVHAWSQLVEGFVQSSLNLGMIASSHDEMHITYLPRSSDNHALETLFDHIRQAYEAIGAPMTVRAQYPGREQDPTALIVTILRDIMTDVLGRVPRVQPIHAGLECGAIVSLCPSITTAVSLGPTIRNPHTINESVSLRSIEQSWTIVSRYLRQCV